MERMKCAVCGGKPKKTKFGYVGSDKYEKWMGIKGKRLWVRCKQCGFHWQLRNYQINRLEGIYQDGYRSKEFRGESIEHAYKRISKIGDSENEERYYWFASRIKYDREQAVLDIGSGIGVWPALLKRAEFSVTCVEENLDSCNFIYDELGISCYTSLADAYGDFDIITILHVLEHIEDLDGFLRPIRKKLRPNGWLFVEVPDSSEFKRLNVDHDEFNSCHVSFFDMASLHRILTRNGFNPIESSVIEYEARGLTRLMMLCQ